MNTNEIITLLEGRRTYRRFDESRQIPDEVVADMKKAARLASCGMNRQSLRFVYVRTPETVNAVFEITKWGAALPNGMGTPKIGERPTLFVAMLYPKGAHNPFDEGLAASNLTLAAYAHGVGSCIIANVKHKELREILQIDESLDISCVIGFGYPTHKSYVVEIAEGEDTKYYLDENRDYVVPKKRIEDVTTEV